MMILSFAALNLLTASAHADGKKLTIRELAYHLAVNSNGLATQTEKQQGQIASEEVLSKAMGANTVGVKLVDFARADLSQGSASKLGKALKVIYTNHDASKVAVAMTNDCFDNGCNGAME